MQATPRSTQQKRAAAEIGESAGCRVLFTGEDVIYVAFTAANVATSSVFTNSDDVLPEILEQGGSVGAA